MHNATKCNHARNASNAYATKCNHAQNASNVAMQFCNAGDASECKNALHGQKPHAFLGKNYTYSLGRRLGPAAAVAAVGLRDSRRPPTRGSWAAMDAEGVAT